MKTCSNCGQEKEDIEFRKRQSKCKDCQNNYLREYRKSNQEKIKDRDRKYYQCNLEKINKQKKEYNKRNSKKISERNKQYQKNNSDKIREYKRKKLKEPKNRFKDNLRSQIKQAFKLYSKNGKTESCKKYGIDFDAIYNKIGPKPDGDFHLDHIIPISVFNFDNPEHVRLAHLPENLRWLDSKENISKSDSIDVEFIACRLSLLSIAKHIKLTPFYSES